MSLCLIKMDSKTLEHFTLSLMNVLKYSKLEPAIYNMYIFIYPYTFLYFVYILLNILTFSSVFLIVLYVTTFLLQLISYLSI